jgi:glycine reductase complex component B subunit gamma
MRVIHYINQFFGQIGGEEKAGVGPRVVDGPVGPGLLINRLMEDRGSVVATLICGDNYFTENMEAASEELSAMMVNRPCDIFIAGPAFNAGRYGIACGEMARIVSARFGIPSVTGMFPENPGVDLYRKKIYIIKTSGSTAGMGKAMAKMVDLAMKLFMGKPVGRPDTEGYIPRGIKQNVVTDKLAAQRAIDMLLAKMKGIPFHTEISFPDLDVVPSAPPIADLKKATIALVTEGGLVPKDNPDGLESARARKWGKYAIDELVSQGASGFRSVHRGFDTTFVNEDPMRLLPVDVMKDFESEGLFSTLFPSYFVTTGVATTMKNAQRIGKEMAQNLASSGVNGIILTST